MHDIYQKTVREKLWNNLKDPCARQIAATEQKPIKIIPVSWTHGQ